MTYRPTPRRISALGSTITPPTKVPIIDNRAEAVVCYDPRYTFVEKATDDLDEIPAATREKEFPVNFMRHYYDVYSLLQRSEVQAFIGTDEYKAHKARRFRRADNPNIAQNEASF